MSTCHRGRITKARLRIVLSPPDAQLINSALYRAGPIQRERKLDEIDKMQEKGVGEPVEKIWASPVVFVNKKNRLLRFCVDYRRLNSVTA